MDVQVDYNGDLSYGLFVLTLIRGMQVGLSRYCDSSLNNTYVLQHLGNVMVPYHAGYQAVTIVT